MAIRTSPAPKRLRALLWHPAFLTILILAAVILVTTTLYEVLEGWPFLTALIFTLSLISTVGEAQAFPLHHTSRVLTAIIYCLTLGTVIVALSTYASRLISMVARGASPMQKNEQALRALSGHIIVAAETTFASLLIQSLRAKAIAFAAITREETLHSRWLEEGVPSVLGDPDEEDVLQRVGVERATGLIVALASDADNVFVSLSAHDLNPRLRIVARAHNASAVPKLRRSGADEVVLPDQIMAINLVELFHTHTRVGALARQVTEQLRAELETPSTPVGGQTQIRAQQILFRALRLALQELSPDMEDALYALGEQFGREAVAPNLDSDGLKSVLAKFPQLWEDLGLGELKIVAVQEDTARIVEESCAMSEGLPSVERPICHLERGVLAGALQAKLERTVSVHETKCWGLGDRVCEFEITVDPHAHSTEE
jgi:predicted hydrocarbon binding protein